MESQDIFTECSTTPLSHDDERLFEDLEAASPFRDDPMLEVVIGGSSHSNNSSLFEESAAAAGGAGEEEEKGGEKGEEAAENKFKHEAEDEEDSPSPVPLPAAGNKRARGGAVVSSTVSSSSSSEAPRIVLVVPSNFALKEENEDASVLSADVTPAGDAALGGAANKRARKTAAAKRDFSPEPACSSRPAKAQVPRKRAPATKKPAAATGASSGGRKKIVRPSYRCGRCGELKVGHECKVKELLISPAMMTVGADGKMNDIVISYSQLLKNGIAGFKLVPAK